jgi:hypothetical protein
LRIEFDKLRSLSFLVPSTVDPRAEWRNHLPSTE